MKGADKKTGAATPAIQNTDIGNNRIPSAGFTVLHHLLYAAKNLHHLPALPDDAIHGVEILMRRIESDLERLKGQRP